MKKQSNGTIPQTGNRDETASIVAETFGVDPSYVRKLVRGNKKPKTKRGQQNAKAIIAAYWSYKNSKSLLKNNLVKAVEKAIAV